MSGNTVTQVEQRVNELSRVLSAAANEFDEARKNHDDASARWEDAQLQLSVAKADLSTYLAGLEDGGKIKVLMCDCGDNEPPPAGPSGPCPVHG